MNESDISVKDKINNGGEERSAAASVTARPTKRKQQAPNISVYTLVSQLKKSQREKLISGYDIKSLAKVFEDADMMKTAEKFLDCELNVSRAARELYMHRNTLIYRLNAIRRLTGFDLKDFNSAVTFRILHTLYLMR